MRPISRREVLDPGTYERIRDRMGDEVLEARRVRRIKLGPNVVCFFENRKTVLHQIQEIIRSRAIGDEQEVQELIKVHNALLGSAKELSCTLLLETDRNPEGARQLRTWIDLPEQIYLKSANGYRIWAQVRDKRVEQTGLFPIQHLTFAIDGQVPVAVGCAYPQLQIETPLTPEQFAALSSDVSEVSSPYPEVSPNWHL